MLATRPAASLATAAARNATRSACLTSSVYSAAASAVPSSSRHPLSSSLPPLSGPSRAAAVGAASPFSTSSRACGKSRPGEGKDSKKAAKRAERQAKQGTEGVAVKEEAFTLEEAVRVLKAHEIARPNNAIEVHITTKIPRNQANGLRGRVNFPHSASNKLPTLLIFAPDGSSASDAAKAYAAANPNSKIIVGGEDLVVDVAENRVGDFDKVLASPDIMAAVSRRLARSLGPKGLMPNPKRGTVASDGEEMRRCIDEAYNMVDWRSDRQSCVRAAVGRAHFAYPEVRRNLRTFLSSVVERATSPNLAGGGSTSKANSAAAGLSGYKIPQRSDEEATAGADVVKRVGSVLSHVHISSTQGPGVLVRLADVL